MAKLTDKDIEEMAASAARREAIESKGPITFEELEVIFRKWLLISDPGLIKLIPAIIVANKLPRDPVWMFLIGPSGSGKTEFLCSLYDLPDIYPISMLTPNTFLSGSPGDKDQSLLHKLKGKIMIFKDWTSILSANKEAMADIMGQLREIYDGQMKKAFGNGRIAEWTGKVGLIAGTTPMVDMSQQMHTTLGERFIHYRLITPDRKEVARRVLDNSSSVDEMRNELKEAMTRFIMGITIKDDIKAPEEVKEEIISLSNFATLSRSGVIRDFGFKKEVIFVPAAEMPTRITQQLDTITVALMVINGGELKQGDMDIVYKIALDSIPQTNRMVMRGMAVDNELTTAEIAADVGYPTAPIRMYLENLAMLGVCSRIRGADSEEGGNADRWTLDPEFRKIIIKYDRVKSREKGELKIDLDKLEEIAREEELGI